MKKLLLLVLLLCGVASAQTRVYGNEADSKFTTTIAKLPTTNVKTGAIAYVLDGTSSSDCTVGGGSVKHSCVYDGSAWVNDGGGGGGGDASTNTAISVINELALFADTSGKLLKRSTGSGLGVLTSGVLSAVDPSACGANSFATDITATGGLTCAQPAFSNLSGSATDAQVPDILTLTKITGLSNGLVKAINADGTLAVAVSGTDYAPATSGSAILKGNGSGGFASAAAGTDYAAATSGSGILKGSSGNTAAATATDMSSIVGCQDAGASDTYACNLSPSPVSYVTGTYYQFKANTANTGVASINFNSIGALTIKKKTSGITTDLADNDIRAGAWVGIIYDGTNAQCVDGCDGNAGGSTPSLDQVTDPAAAKTFNFDNAEKLVLQGSTATTTTNLLELLAGTADTGTGYLLYGKTLGAKNGLKLECGASATTTRIFTIFGTDGVEKAYGDCSGNSTWNSISFASLVVDNVPVGGMAVRQTLTWYPNGSSGWATNGFVTSDISGSSANNTVPDASNAYTNMFTTGTVDSTVRGVTVNALAWRAGASRQIRFAAAHYANSTTAAYWYAGFTTEGTITTMFPATNPDTYASAHLAGFYVCNDSGTDCNADSTNIKCTLANASARTSADSGVASSTTASKLLVVHEQSDGTWKWYIDGTEVCSGISQTNKPTAGTNMKWVDGIETLTTTDVRLFIEGVEVGGKRH